MSDFLTKEELLHTVPMPEKIFLLPSGKSVLLRCLKPSERMKVLYAEEEDKLVLMLHLALKNPALDLPEARRFLDGDPFSALAVCREIREMARSFDHKQLTRYQEDDDQAFLTVLGSISRILEKKT